MILVSNLGHHAATECAPAMSNGNAVQAGLPAVGGKPVHLAFDGGRLTSDAGVLLLAPIERRLGPTALTRMMAAMTDLFCDSFTAVPERIVLDIDDTEDEVHGSQQLALFNAH